MCVPLSGWVRIGVIRRPIRAISAPADEGGLSLWFPKFLEAGFFNSADPSDLPVASVPEYQWHVQKMSAG